MMRLFFFVEPQKVGKTSQIKGHKRQEIAGEGPLVVFDEVDLEGRHEVVDFFEIKADDLVGCCDGGGHLIEVHHENEQQDACERGEDKSPPPVVEIKLTGPRQAKEVEQNGDEELAEGHGGHFIPEGKILGEISCQVNESLLKLWRGFGAN